MKPIVRLFTTCSPPLLISGTSIRNSFKKGISVSFAFFASSVLAVAQLSVPEGFVAEKIYDVPNKEQGSWISLAADHKGYIYAGSEKHGLPSVTDASGINQQPQQRGASRSARLSYLRRQSHRAGFQVTQATP